MRNAFRVTDGMRSEKPLVAARAYLKAGLKLILVHGIAADSRYPCHNCDSSHVGNRYLMLPPMGVLLFELKGPLT